jgi:selenocysteine lyase/cysteine desulfurase
VREALVEALEPRITSWFATENQFDFDLEKFKFRADARRFELGTPSLPTIHTSLGGQEIIDEVGIEAIVEQNGVLTHRLVEKALSAGFDVLQPTTERRTAIVMVHHDDPPDAVRYLSDHGVIVDHRPGFVRVSPHFYNTEEEVDLCVDLLTKHRG